MLLGEFERIIGPDRVPALASHSNSENDPRQDPAGIGARAVADAEAPRAPTRREKASGSLTVKTESGPPMTLGNADRDDRDIGCVGAARHRRPADAGHARADLAGDPSRRARLTTGLARSCGSSRASLHRTHNGRSGSAAGTGQSAPPLPFATAVGKRLSWVESRHSHQNSCAS